jgi:hypothetical protein
MRPDFVRVRRLFPMDVRYLTDEDGERIGVLLGIEEYERLIEELEELADARAAEDARRELASGEDEVIPFEQAVREIREGKVLHD